MTNTIDRYLFEGTESISIVHSCAYYRYAQAHVRIHCTVESGVTRRYNVEGVRTHESVMNGSAMMLHNRITLKLFRHSSGSSMTLHNTRALKAFGHASEFSIWFYVKVLEIRRSYTIQER